MRNAANVDLSIVVMEARAGQDDRSVVTDLIERGVAFEEAEWLVALVPIAFTHVLFEQGGPTFASTYQCMGEDGRVSPEYPLADEPIYLRAVGAARRAGRETMTAIASRSAELNVINQLLSPGSRLEDLALTPPVLVRVFQPAAPKPWWKFW
jgi:hypothetical protein